MPLLDWLHKKQAVTAAENWLIQGDNLDAPKVLLPFHAGRMKCVFNDSCR